MTDPALAPIAATVALALDAFGGPPERARECVARLYGLRGADSLLPWIDGQTDDVAELARLDYEPTAGADWPTVWEGHLAESFVVLKAQVGPAWKDRVRPQMCQSVKANCRQSTEASSNQNGGVRHAA